MSWDAANETEGSTVLPEIDRQLADDPLWWCLRPFLETVRFWPASTWQVKAAAIAPLVSLQPVVHRAGGVLAVMSTRNQRRALSPVIEALAGRSVPDRAGTGRLHFSPAGLLTRRSGRDIEQAGLDVLNDLGLRHVRPVWSAFATNVRVAMRQASRTLDALRGASGAAVLVASQHDPLIRAWLVHANGFGIPSLCIPHAPVARAAHYVDLPFTAVGLRGAAEREFYARLGADSSRIFVVGNPASDLLKEGSRAVPSGPGVLALSAWPTAQLAEVVGLVKDAAIDDLIVAPHPRSAPAAVRAQLPRSWRTWTRPTAELLKEGVSFVIQHSSGVAWESAALGIPTAQIILGESPASYPFLDDDAFAKCPSGEALHRFAQQARSGRWASENVMAAARRWCEIDGSSAREAAREFVLDNANAPAGAMVLDGWGLGGVAYARSQITVTAAGSS